MSEETSIGNIVYDITNSNGDSFSEGQKEFTDLETILWEIDKQAGFLFDTLLTFLVWPIDRLHLTF